MSWLWNCPDAWYRKANTYLIVGLVLALACSSYYTNRRINIIREVVSAQTKAIIKLYRMDRPLRIGE